LKGVLKMLKALADCYLCEYVKTREELLNYLSKIENDPRFKVYKYTESNHEIEFYLFSDTIINDLNADYPGIAGVFEETFDLENFVDIVVENRCPIDLIDYCSEEIKDDATFFFNDNVTDGALRDTDKDFTVDYGYKERHYQSIKQYIDENIDNFIASWKEFMNEQEDENIE
jgi:hypothetical protein